MPEILHGHSWSVCQVSSKSVHFLRGSTSRQC